jgi:hypothetical protein
MSSFARLAAQSILLDLTGLLTAGRAWLLKLSRSRYQRVSSTGAPPVILRSMHHSVFGASY